MKKVAKRPEKSFDQHTFLESAITEMAQARGGAGCTTCVLGLASTTRRFMTKHTTPGGSKTESKRVRAPGLKPGSQDMQGPGAAQRSGNAISSPTPFPG